MGAEPATRWTAEAFASPGEQWVEDLALIAETVAVDITEARMSRDPNRWRRFHVLENPLAVDIVARVWGHSPPMEWQMLAVALVSQRLEDDQPTPSTSVDPIRTELEELIESELQERREG